MSNKQDHFIQMNMAIEEMAPEEYWMYFTPARPEKGEFYAVTGRSTNIQGFLDDFKKTFGDTKFGKELHDEGTVSGIHGSEQGIL